jgi:hypothetical protein
VCDPINPVVNLIPRLIIVATYARQYLSPLSFARQRLGKRTAVATITHAGLVVFCTGRVVSKESRPLILPVSYFIYKIIFYLAILSAAQIV